MAALEIGAVPHGETVVGPGGESGTLAEPAYMSVAWGGPAGCGLVGVCCKHGSEAGTGSGGLTLCRGGQD